LTAELAALRRMALNVMLKDTPKGSLRGKFKRAGGGVLPRTCGTNQDGGAGRGPAPCVRRRSITCPIRAAGLCWRLPRVAAVAPAMWLAQPPVGWQAADLSGRGVASPAASL
jgi:hypothetical protein